MRKEWSEFVGRIISPIAGNGLVTTFVMVSSGRPVNVRVYGSAGMVLRTEYTQGTELAIAGEVKEYDFAGEKVEVITARRVNLLTPLIKNKEETLEEWLENQVFAVAF